MSLREGSETWLYFDQVEDKSDTKHPQWLLDFTQILDAIPLTWQQHGIRGGSSFLRNNSVCQHLWSSSAQGIGLPYLAN